MGVGSILASFYLFIIFFSFTESRERGREGGREGEKHVCERETLIGCLLHVLGQGTVYFNPGVCPDWESTCYLWFARPMPNQLSHTSQGAISLILKMRMGKVVIPVNFFMVG